MDEKQYLILTLTKGKWEDSTAKILSLTPYSNGYEVKYEKDTYKYRHAKIKIFTAIEIIDLTRFKVFVNSQPTSKEPTAVIRFKNDICIFYPGYKQRYPIENVSIVEDISSNKNAQEILNYYAAIAAFKKHQTAMQHLDNAYRTKLKLVAKSSVATRFIEASTPSTLHSATPFIFPFGVNLSQRAALKNALQNQLSLIKGPPGTGKTQTILNLIANLIIQNKNIAVVAGNNSAVANVYEKLEKSDLGFVAALLGRSSQVEDFFSNLPKVPNMSGWALSFQQQNDIKNRLKSLNDAVSQLQESRNKLAEAQSYMSKLTLEHQYFQFDSNAAPLQLKRLSIFRTWQASEIIQFMAEFEHDSLKAKLNWTTKLKWLFKYRIYKFDGFDLTDGNTFKQIVSEYYQAKIKETRQQIEGLEHELRIADLTSLLEQQRTYSMRLFKAYLAQKYSSLPDPNITATHYKKNQYQDFIQRFPVTLSTTHSLISNKPTHVLFDYLIVDEASQVDLVTGFLAMCCAKNLVVVGDEKQLPHIANDELPVNIKHFFDNSSPYHFKNNSLLTSVDRLFAQIPKTLLKEHYRCHPQIIEFCNQKYYNGQLIVMSQAEASAFKILQTAKGNHAARPASGAGYVNQRELDVISREVLPEELNNSQARDIGIITPYREQANKCSKMMKEIGIDTDTVHKFQGREKDTIIFTTTANKINRHIDQAELINVTVSRAKNRLVIVSSESLVKEHATNIGDLMRYIEYQSQAKAIVESKTISIFDCLYSEYSEELKDFRNRVKRESKYPSEDFMSTLLDDLLNTGKYGSLTYKKDYPLSFLFAKNNNFTKREAEFVQHPTSHIDFILYNKMDKLPVLAIEVDGYQFHDLNPLQLNRDEIKNSVCKKVNLPLARFSTKGSGEKEWLTALLSRWQTNLNS